MIPQQRLSTTPVRSTFVLQRPQPTLTRSRHLGGIAVGDASQGFNVQVWTLETNGTTVTLAGELVAPVTLFTGTGITEVSLAFDLNMRPFVAFVAGGVAQFRWWDSTVQQFVITPIRTGAIRPRCTLDDSRPGQSQNADVILAYMVGSALFFRAQRDRYTIEYPLATGLFNLLDAVGMGVNLRLHFALGAAIT